MSNPFHPASLFTLSTLDNSFCAHLLCVNYLNTFTSPTASLSLSLYFSLSLSEPCELATLSGLSIRAYHPRGQERITFLTSLCQMFMTKIDRTTSNKTKSNNVLVKNLTPTCAWLHSCNLTGKYHFFSFPFLIGFRSDIFFVFLQDTKLDVGVGLRPSLFNFILIYRATVFVNVKCISDGLLSHVQKNQKSYLVEGWRLSSFLFQQASCGCYDTEHCKRKG